MPYVKLDCGMLDSTTWFDKDGRDVFITALLMATPKEFDEPLPQLEIHSLNETGWTVPPGWYGFVDAASTGIISRCGISMDRGLAALDRLGAPEVESRSQQHDGRRMVRVNGGFVILNYINYREKDHTAADRQRRYRERQKNRNAVTSRNITQAEAEAEAEENKPNGLNLSAWDDYVAHRKDLRAKRLTPKGRQMAMKKLAGISQDRQRAVVDTSIANGWIGLFPEKLNEKNYSRPDDSFDTQLKELRQRAGLDPA